MNPGDVPAAYVLQVAQVESGGNPNARAKTSSATGLFQFTTATWDGLRRQFPGLRLTIGGRTDSEQSERAFRQFTADNAAVFYRGIGRPASMSELYLCHFLGSCGAIAACSARPGALVSEILGQKVVTANRFLDGMTCADLRAWARRKVPDALPAFSRQAPARTPPLGKPPATTADLNDAELRRIRDEDKPD